MQAALANNRGITSSTGFVDTERVDVLHRALDRVGASDPRSRALLLALVAAELNYNNEPAQRRLLADEAHALARECGDRRTLLRVLNTTHDTIWAADTVEEVIALEHEAVALARELDDPVGTFMALDNAVAGRYASGRSSQDLIDEATAIAEDLREPTLQWMARMHTPIELFRCGDVSGAEAAVEESFALGTDVGEPDAITFYAGQITNVRWAQGRRAELVPILAPVAEQLRSMPSAHAVLAVCHLDAGDAHAARALLDTELPKAPAIPTDQLWIHAVILWAEVATRLADAPAASSLIERLHEYVQLFAFSGGTLEGSVADALGRLETVLGNFDRADEYFDIADTVNERLDAPFFIALTKLHRADMQIRRDAARDREQSTALLVDVLEIACRHGFAGIEETRSTSSISRRRRPKTNSGRRWHYRPLRCPAQGATLTAPRPRDGPDGSQSVRVRIETDTAVDHRRAAAARRGARIRTSVMKRTTLAVSRHAHWKSALWRSVPAVRPCTVISTKSG